MFAAAHENASKLSLAPQGENDMSHSKTALITGAGQGIGRAIAESMIADGHRVIATDRDLDLLVSLDCERAAMDVRDLDAINRTIAPVEDLEILVNCAGLVSTDTAATTTDEVWELIYQVNIRSMFWTIRAALPAMIARQRGSIINISSTASSVAAAPQRFTYGTTKAAIIGLTKSVAVDYIRQGIRANAICPGPILTPSMQSRLGGQRDADAQATFIARQPMGRFGTAVEIAGFVRYLTSDEGSFATGQAFIIDGGLTLAAVTEITG
jgi:2-keto-3-deoxy-L-fuconate dehydrogenase